MTPDARCGPLAERHPAITAARGTAQLLALRDRRVPAGWSHRGFGASHCVIVGQPTSVKQPSDLGGKQLTVSCDGQP